MSQVIACVDESASMSSVCDYAAWAANRLRTGVQLLHILDPREYDTVTPDYSGNPGLGGADAALEAMVVQHKDAARQAQQRGQAVIDRASARLQDAGILQMEAHQRHGSLVESVAGISSSAALIVIGKHGETTVRTQDHVGKHLEVVVRGVHTPVLVTPRDFQPIDRIMLAFDGSPSTRKAVEFVETSSLLRGVECRIVSVGKDECHLRTQAEQAADRLVNAGFEVTVDLLAGKPDQVLANLTTASGANLLVMGAYGHSRIRELIIGSTTTAILRSSPVPVLIIR